MQYTQTSVDYLQTLDDGCLTKLLRNLNAILKHKLNLPKKNNDKIVNTLHVVNEILLARQKFLH